MNVEYTPRARADLQEIADYSRKTFGRAVAAALETYIRATVARIAAMPESGVAIQDRQDVRVVPLIRYPFRNFYTAADETITILHVRHTSRRPWQAGE
jgi:toxin ParE1/3/4